MISSAKVRRPAIAAPGAANDPAAIEVGLQGPRRGHELRIVQDRAGQPVDVRGLKRGNLAERVTVELAEFDREAHGVGQRGIGRSRS